MLTEIELREKIAELEKADQALPSMTIKHARNSYLLGQAYYQLGEKLSSSDRSIEKVELYLKAMERDNADAIAKLEPNEPKHSRNSEQDTDLNDAERRDFEALPPKMLCFLGYQYYAGIGVQRNVFKAFSFFERAADQGYAPAQCKVGQMYEQGIAVEQNYTRALEYYRRAVEQGYAIAQHKLSILYCQPNAQRSVYREHIRLLQMAAEGGSVDAQYLLGFTLYKGQDSVIAPNVPEAMKWSRLAVAHGYLYAKDILQRAAATLPVEDGLYYLVVATGERQQEMISQYPDQFVECLLNDPLMTNELRLEWFQKIYEYVETQLKRTRQLIVTPNHFGHVCYAVAVDIFEHQPNKKALKKAAAIYQKVPPNTDKYAEAQADLARVCGILKKTSQSDECMRLAAASGDQCFSELSQHCPNFWQQPVEENRVRKVFSALRPRNR